MHSIKNRWGWIVVAALVVAAVAVACRATPQSTAVQPTAPPATALVAEPTPSSTAAQAAAASVTPDPGLGAELWPQKPCIGCHGASAGGAVGPKLAGIALSLDETLQIVRSGRGSMPAFGEDRVSDLELGHIHAWLRSLAPRTPTSTATTPPPTATPTPTTVPATQPPDAPTFTPAPTPTPTPTPTPLPTATSTPAPTPTPPLPAVPDAAVGQQVWGQQPCLGCHGASAEGGIGPKLAGTGLTYDQVLLKVRTGAAPMPAYSAEQISDLALQHIFAWLRSLAPPTPTPVAAALYPTDALRAMWQHVNDMKVKCDFAKDLPERQAADDAGRLSILKVHATDAVNLGNMAIAQANQALNDIPDAKVGAVIRRVIDETNAVVALGNQALGQGSFGSAWPLVAEMVYVSRLDAWPLATQAVRDAGLRGNVRVQVTNSAGAPLAGAFVTVLTAHTPVGVRTNASGQATIWGVASIPALQVKAYAAGLVYHEIHVNLSPGTTGGGSIVLPGPSVGGQTPLVTNAAIEPASGPGNATVTLRVTATDPQGAKNLAEDQIFALNPNLGVAYIMRHVGGDQYEKRVTLPNLGKGAHTWHFFAVDHQCNTSGVLAVQYVVQ